MATSSETFQAENVQDIDIKTLYKELMQISTENGSVYLRAKETLQDLCDENGLTSSEKAQVIGSTISTIATGITSTAMSTALAIAKENRDAKYLLAKVREETILTQENANKIATDITKIENEKKLQVYAGWKAQAELVVDYGAQVYNVGATTDIIPEAQYAAEGTKYEAIRQAKSNVYSTYATAYRGSGYVALDLNPDGTLAAGTTGNEGGLTYAQEQVAIRQEEGFDDNMRQHVANSSASMISLLLSQEGAFNYDPYLQQWSNSIQYLNTTRNATAGSILNDVPPASISKAVGATLTGTTTNISAGTSVTVRLIDQTVDSVITSSDVIGIVQLDGTWSAAFTSTVLNGLPVASYELEASTADSTGTVRVDTDLTSLVA